MTYYHERDSKHLQILFEDQDTIHLRPGESLTVPAYCRVKKLTYV